MFYRLKQRMARECIIWLMSCERVICDEVFFGIWMQDVNCRTYNKGDFDILVFENQAIFLFCPCSSLLSLRKSLVYVLFFFSLGSISTFLFISGNLFFVNRVSLQLLFFDDICIYYFIYIFYLVSLWLFRDNISTLIMPVHYLHGSKLMVQLYFWIVKN